MWSDADGDGIHDADEPAAPGFAVRLLDAGGSALTTAVSAQDGSFTFAGLAPSTYQLEVDLPSGQSVTAMDQVPTGVDPRHADDVDSDFAIHDLLAGTARSQPIGVNGAPVDDIGLGLVPLPATTTTTPTTVPTTPESSTTLQPTTTAETTTTAVTTTTVGATTTTSEASTTTQAATTTQSSPTTQPPTTAATTVP